MQQVVENAASLTMNLYISDSADEYMITLPTDENGHLHLQRDVIIVCYKYADKCVFNKINFCFSPKNPSFKKKCLKKVFE